MLNSSPGNGAGQMQDNPKVDQRKPKQRSDRGERTNDDFDGDRFHRERVEAPKDRGTVPNDFSRA
jgi:hypothetical protein